MFGWLKKKFYKNKFYKNKSVDDIIAESFSEEGRWQEISVNSWTDTKTGAVLTSHRHGGMTINEIPISMKVHQAFWHELYTVPRLAKEAAEKAALEKLYANP